MINILQKHVAHYPNMQVQDLAKLLYQSEFGGGHMIADPEKSLKRIHEEYQSMNPNDTASPTVIEPIGDGMCRIYLSALSNHLTAELLNQMFVLSANHRKGTTEGLEQKIKSCLKACEEGILPYDLTDAENFFEKWKVAGYPAMSHSNIYRENYRPAYRVIESSYVQVYEIIQKIEQGMHSSCADRPFVVAIDGMSASGKSTLGQLLQQNYPESNLFHMDDYFLQPHQRTPKRMAEAGGNVDYERFHEEIILHLANPNGLTYRAYDCCTQTLGREMHVPFKPLIIIEGAYSQHPYFGDIYNLRVFCEITKEEQRDRILNRNGAEMLKRFENEWIPKENQYFETFHIKEKSGLQ